MIPGLFLVAVLAASIYGIWRAVAPSPQHRHGWLGVLRLACVIAVVRVGAFWLGLAGLHSSGWWQVPGFLFVMFAWPEIVLVRQFREKTLLWGLATSAVLTATSFVWAALALHVAARVCPISKRLDQGL